jgi:hypothetical protein
MFIRRSSSQAAALRFRRKLALVLLVVSRRIMLRTIFFSEAPEILRRVVLADGACVLAEAGVEDPVKLVFHAPVGAGGYSQLFSGQYARADVVTPLQSRLFVADLAQ